jgi:hypothetical protein
VLMLNAFPPIDRHQPWRYRTKLSKFAAIL